MNTGFAVWVTGLPASGKSTMTSALIEKLEALGVNVAVLESDVLRKVFTPKPRYDEEEREIFYQSMLYVGQLLTQHGVSVIFDATANRRAYRAAARAVIPHFLEVFLDSPLSICMARDPKGIYKKGREGAASTVPGLQSAYEPPENPELVIQGGEENPESGAQKVIEVLLKRGWLSGGDPF